MSKWRKPKPQADRLEPKRQPERHEPNWQVACSTCGEVPTHPLTGLCGPCTFGEAETAGGNW